MKENIIFKSSVTAPNPNEVTYWIDLNTDPTGGSIKHWNGKIWLENANGSIALEISVIRESVDILRNSLNTETSAIWNELMLKMPMQNGQDAHDSIYRMFDSFSTGIGNAVEKVQTAVVELEKGLADQWESTVNQDNEIREQYKQYTDNETGKLLDYLSEHDTELSKIKDRLLALENPQV